MLLISAHNICFCAWKHVVGTHQKYLCDALLMGTHNTCIVLYCIAVFRPSQLNGSCRARSLTSIVRSLLKDTDNCPSWISGMERMTVENLSWSISTKECCRPGEGWTSKPLITSQTRIQLSHQGRHNVFLCRYKKTSLMLWLKKCLIWSHGITLVFQQTRLSKQCRSRSYVTACGIWSWAQLFKVSLA